ncbi:hypothetical protein N7456_005597 [Penicillium angulare]|uniref:Uncharacterized protein n=1 Tax=Penicillium angulare TaxID=116970 RepID=A0A9W9G0C2_9EURO|nr:hypothetical protein N7456_005597 [Penicillium angulare]
MNTSYHRQKRSNETAELTPPHPWTAPPMVSIQAPPQPQFIQPKVMPQAPQVPKPGPRYHGIFSSDDEQMAAARRQQNTIQRSNRVIRRQGESPATTPSLSQL